jgi:hypothetical protein
MKDQRTPLVKAEDVSPAFVIKIEFVDIRIGELQRRTEDDLAPQSRDGTWCATGSLATPWLRQAGRGAGEKESERH